MPRSHDLMPSTLSAMLSSRPSATTATVKSIQTLPLVLGLLLLLGVAVQRSFDGWRSVLLWLIGLALGLALYHASFGFASAYRRMIVKRDMRGVLAQLLLLALTTTLFAPVLAQGEIWGQGLGGAWAPVGVSVVIGAFMFGVGMQIAGGCGSGTLYTAGGGSLRMMVVLVSACAGSFWASLHMGWWQALPSHEPVVLADLWGWRTALMVQLGVIAALAELLRWLARPVTASVPSVTHALGTSMMRGPWPVWVAAVVLALGNLATLVTAGHPWSITWGFTLWGAKTAQTMGWQAANSGFWLSDFQSSALAGSVLQDTTSLMDLGIMLGAALAATLAGRFSPKWDFPWRSLLAAVLGGLLLGYGSRISYGCNIGAFVSGVASGSLHGWLWVAAALPGTWLGIGLRRQFGMAD